MMDELFKMSLLWVSVVIAAVTFGWVLGQVLIYVFVSLWENRRRR